MKFGGGKSVCTGIPKESHPYDSAYNTSIYHTQHMNVQQF